MQVIAVEKKSLFADSFDKNASDERSGERREMSYFVPYYFERYTLSCYSSNICPVNQISSPDASRSRPLSAEIWLMEKVKVDVELEQ